MKQFLIMQLTAISSENKLKQITESFINFGYAKIEAKDSLFLYLNKKDTSDDYYTVCGSYMFTTEFFKKGTILCFDSVKLFNGEVKYSGTTISIFKNK